MPQIYSPRTRWYIYALLVAVSSVPFIRLMWGEYLYDDHSHIEINQTLNSLKNFSEVLGFKMQPSRPISSWTMAIVHLAGGGQLWAHRLASLLLHVATTLLVFITVLRVHSARPGSPAKGFALFAALAFAWHPLQAEVIGVGSFRWEQWAAISTLLCINLAVSLSKENKESLWIVLFFSLGLAFLSKETFSILAPLAVVGVFFYTNTLTSKIFLRVAFMTVPWGLLLACLLQQPTNFTYEAILGKGLEERFELIGASSNALAEQAWKMFSGQRLVFLRLFEREGVLGPLTVWQAAGVFLCTLALWAATWWRKGLIRFWGTLFFSGTLLYIAIPNINVGSQHYYYYLLIPFLCLIGQVAWELATATLKSPRKVAITVAGAYLVLFFGSLQSRILDLRSRKDFNLAELRNHPESPRAWAIAIDTFRIEGENTLTEEAYPLILAAYERFQERLYFRLLYVEFLYAHGRIDEAYKLSNSILEQAEREKQFGMGLFLATKAARAGDCLGTKDFLMRTLEEKPIQEQTNALLKGLAKVVSETPEKCVRL